ncbi:MAG TPA: hypothetical protein VNA19_04485, partial [Pyrinomonadaceae bacterium]|nr:hypothetical protein [Pyrinomonadaceae bacterium]
NMRAMFAREQEQRDASETAKTNGAEASASPAAARVGEEGQGATEGEAAKSTPAPILSEAQALRELPAIPVYFASSYALVKPYVRGFEANLLDVPSLKHVRLDTDWKPPAGTEVIRVVSNR